MVFLDPKTNAKTLFYCHDSFGLGHLTRTLTIARYLRARTPSMSELIVTGSPIPHKFCFPDGSDYIKLPSVVKVGRELYEARNLAMSFDEVRELRSEMLLSAARHFGPDLLVVDHAPAGLKGEIVPTLRYLKSVVGHARLVLGLRDIVDDATTVRHAWARDGVYELLDRVYDLILVYGDRDVYDVVREYDLSTRAAAKVRYVGYLRRDAGVRSGAQVRAELGLKTERLVVVTAGGGGDGFELLSMIVAALRANPGRERFDWLLVAGPLMPAEDREWLRQMLPSTASVHFMDFAEDMASYIAAADAVVGMGGYNSVCEILSCKRAAIIIPRVAPRREQLLRAEALQQRGVVRMIHPADLSPERLLREVEDLLEQEAADSPQPPLDGLPAVVAALDDLLLDARAVPLGRALAAGR